MRRRLIALLVVLGFGLFTAESLIADACDGDAEVASAQVSGEVDAGDGADRPVPPRGHGMHVCHCVHAHGGLPVLADREPSALDGVSSLVSFVGSTPASPPLELPLRPPIA